MFVVAVAARVMVIVRDGGLHGYFGYDAGVYFAAGDALVHGRLPYRDFVLIHPPAITLVLSPFAELTRVMSDESAFTAAVLACTVLGGVNAVLVVRVVRALGLGMRCAGVAGLFYALWFGAVGSEYLIKLEPVGNLLFLLGLLAALRAVAGGGTRWAVATGLSAGAAVSVKIWWIVPVAALVCCLGWRTRRVRTMGAALAGVAAISLLIDGPFFLAAPHAMWTSVVVEQLARPAASASPLTRLTDLSSLPRLTGPLSQPQMAVVSAAVLIAAGWVGRRAWTVRAARPAVVLLAVQAIVLLAAPSWFPFYADFVAVAAALTVGAAARAGPVRAMPVRAMRVRAMRVPAMRVPAMRVPAIRVWALRSRVMRALSPGSIVTAAVAVITVAALISGRPAVRPFRGARVLSRSAGAVHCVLSDSPMGLIEVDALSRSFADGCRDWVDVTGRTYGPDRGTAARRDNGRWQRDLTGYLRSGNAVIIVRAGGTGLSPSTWGAVRRDGVLVRAGGHTLYRVRQRVP